eukprot:gb/GFBE01045850.1/.p1 GENE.gb/GFBE01045850.1/~~gb/GFBE01045850.1/.p1  ORF type:complete len:346 (+),score=58.38 gb/GFBE01045850.1/:1-1038(+)
MQLFGKWVAIPALLSVGEASKTRFAPPSGAAFLVPQALEELPEPREDKMAAEYLVNRLSNLPSQFEQGPAHACDDGNMASKNRCLTVENRQCMWVRLKSHDPRPLVPNEQAYCMPCQLDGEDMPCWNSGAWLGASQVVECEMSCLHQKRVMQPQYSCTDFTGVDSQTSCFGRGDQTDSKCMFITYKDEHGAMKSSCAPCDLKGVGKIDCPAVGGKGPEDNSTVALCASQCEAPRPEAGIAIAPAVTNPGLGRTSGAADEMVSAPVSPPLPPAEGETALATRAQVIELMTTTPVYPPPPPEYFPMVVYKSPQDYAATTIGPLPAELSWPVQLPSMLQEKEKRRLQR